MPKAKPSTPDYQKMFILAENYSEASRLLAEQAKGEGWGCSAPQLLVDSFAVELYLKCLFVLDTNTAPPRGHDWEILFDELLPHTKTMIREAFERIVQADTVLSNLHIINPDALKVIDFRRSLVAAKSTFDKKRYLYEATTQGEWFYAHLLTDAIRTVTKLDLRVARLSPVCTEKDADNS